MIRNYKDKKTELIAQKKPLKGFPSNLINVAARKIYMLANASELNDLRSPPGNRLEALKGDRKGQHSIRINRKWRICFGWTNTGPIDVEITDYH